jgi:hypothetical protein
MQRNRVWLFSVKRQALVLAAVAMLAMILGVAQQAAVRGDVICVPAATGGCAGPVAGGSCIGAICPAGASSAGASAAAPQSNDQVLQSVNLPAAPTTAPLANGTVCIMPETITGPVAAPGVGFPAGIGNYSISSMASGTFTVCQGGSGIQISGPANALVRVSRHGVGITITLDTTGAGSAASSAFAQ